ncbi:MAG TPA: helix-hairpin-helix domain-containing protein [Bacteroidota bacterium]|nr:helix-hairpin-helix domain-containing protein [Bacteroidota bacterium]
MNIRRSSLLVLLFVRPLPHAFGAPDTLRVVFDEEVERLLEFESEEGGGQVFANVLDAVHDQPVDINRASEVDLLQVPGISPVLARRILAQRSIRQFNQIDDLVVVQGVTPDLLRVLEPFLTTGHETPGSLSRVRLRTRATRTGILPSDGQSVPGTGSPFRFYNRLSASLSPYASDDERLGLSNQMSAVTLGLVTEKDPGEAHYLDFVGGHLSLDLPALGARVVLGDFDFEAGQGLIFWRSAGSSKGAEATSGIARSGIGIRPSFSTDASWGFRGIAASAAFNGFSLAAFVSNKLLDAAVDSTGKVSRIDTDGLHRTTTELAQRNALREKTLGARIAFKANDVLRCGMSGSFSEWSRALSLPGAFGIEGNRLTNLGFDFAASLSMAHLFGEIAQDGSSQLAFVGGILVEPRAGTTLVVAVRSYPPGFRALHGAGFSENGLNDVNERGIYFGFSSHPASWLALKGFWDSFAFPWRSSAAHLPSEGEDVLLLGEAEITRKVSLEILVRHRTKSAFAVMSDRWGLSQSDDESRSQENLRGTLSLNATGSFVWKSRVEIVQVRHSELQTKEVGALAFQDVSFSPARRTTVAMRMVAFDTPSYDSRLYEFEEEVPGSYQTPALYGRGFRWYLLGWCQFFGRVGVSLKYSQTWQDYYRTSRFNVMLPQALSNNQITVQMDVRL